MRTGAMRDLAAQMAASWSEVADDLRSRSWKVVAVGQVRFDGSLSWEKIPPEEQQANMDLGVLYKEALDHLALPGNLLHHPPTWEISEVPMDTRLPEGATAFIITSSFPVAVPKPLLNAPLPSKQAANMLTNDPGGVCSNQLGPWLARIKTRPETWATENCSSEAPSLAVVSATTAYTGSLPDFEVGDPAGLSPVHADTLGKPVPGGRSRRKRRATYKPYYKISWFVVGSQYTPCANKAAAWVGHA